MSHDEDEQKRELQKFTGGGAEMKILNPKP